MVYVGYWDKTRFNNIIEANAVGAVIFCKASSAERIQREMTEDGTIDNYKWFRVLE